MHIVHTKINIIRIARYLCGSWALCNVNACSYRPAPATFKPIQMSYGGQSISVGRIRARCHSRLLYTIPLMREWVSVYGLVAHSTQNWSFRRRVLRDNWLHWCWQRIHKTNKHALVKTQKHTKPNPKTVYLQELLTSVCIWLCTIVLHTVLMIFSLLPSSQSS